MLVFIEEQSLSTLIWVPICQGFSHFQVFCIILHWQISHQSNWEIFHPPPPRPPSLGKTLLRFPHQPNWVASLFMGAISYLPSGIWNFNIPHVSAILWLRNISPQENPPQRFFFHQSNWMASPLCGIYFWLPCPRYPHCLVVRFPNRTEQGASLKKTTFSHQDLCGPLLSISSLPSGKPSSHHVLLFIMRAISVSSSRRYPCCLVVWFPNRTSWGSLRKANYLFPTEKLCGPLPFKRDISCPPLRKIPSHIFPWGSVRPTLNGSYFCLPCRKNPHCLVVRFPNRTEQGASLRKTMFSQQRICVAPPLQGSYFHPSLRKTLLTFSHQSNWMAFSSSWDLFLSTFAARSPNALWFGSLTVPYKAPTRPPWPYGGKSSASGVSAIMRHI